MKAKDHIAQVRAAIEAGKGEWTAITELLSAMNADVVAQAHYRAGGNKPHDGILLPLLRERDLQWRAIARAFDWNPDGWKELWKSKGIEI